MANVFCYYQKLLIEAVNLDQTRPSKQCECCNYLLDKSLISQGCLSGPAGPGPPGGQDGPGCQCGPSGQGGKGGQCDQGGQGPRWSGLMICIQKTHGLHCLSHQIIEKS